MFRARWLSVLSSVGIGLAWVGFALPWAPAQQPAQQVPPPPAGANGVKPEDGMEVDARGPVHEAYAKPMDKNVTPGPVAPKKPPAAIPEEPPDQKPNAASEWIPGYWGWDADRKDFIWISGFWRVPPPGRKWTPGQWVQADNGWQWVGGMWAVANQDLQRVPEPPPSVDNGPSVPAPNDNSVYIPGNWQLRDDNYVWRPGFWSEAYSDWVWNPSYYSWTPNGCVYVPGYWDYPLADRGLLYAPVYFNRPLWQTPGWAYRPCWTVDVGGLFFSSLFIGPYCCHYYFGDYFSPYYARAGFWPWYAWGRNYHDPLFNYYRWANRGDGRWYAGLRNDYWGRRNGELARPDRNAFLRTANAARLAAPLNQRGGTNRVAAPQNRVASPQGRQQQNLSMQRNRTDVNARQFAPTNAIRQSGYSGVTNNNGVRAANNPARFREQPIVRPSGAQYAAPYRNSAPAYRGSSHVMPARSPSSASFHGGGHGGGGGRAVGVPGGGGHGGGGHGGGGHGGGGHSGGHGGNGGKH